THRYKLTHYVLYVLPSSNALSASPLAPFFSDATATTVVYPLSLHDALPICIRLLPEGKMLMLNDPCVRNVPLRIIDHSVPLVIRSEEHTSELQSRFDLVCRLLLEKKNINVNAMTTHKIPSNNCENKRMTRRP